MASGRNITVKNTIQFLKRISIYLANQNKLSTKLWSLFADDTSIPRSWKKVATLTAEYIRLSKAEGTFGQIEDLTKSFSSTGDYKNVQKFIESVCVAEGFPSSNGLLLILMLCSTTHNSDQTQKTKDKFFKFAANELHNHKKQWVSQYKSWAEACLANLNSQDQLALNNAMKAASKKSNKAVSNAVVSGVVVLGLFTTFKCIKKNLSGPSSRLTLHS